jgi:hypothetical protein
MKEVVPLSVGEVQSVGLATVLCCQEPHGLFANKPRSDCVSCLDHDPITLSVGEVQSVGLATVLCCQEPHGLFAHKLYDDLFYPWSNTSCWGFGSRSV